MEKHSQSDFIMNDGVKLEIKKLEEQLENASRTQSKIIREKLGKLNKDKDNYR
jgi:hypothetical protein